MLFVHVPVRMYVRGMCARVLRVCAHGCACAGEIIGVHVQARSAHALGGAAALRKN